MGFSRHAMPTPPIQATEIAFIREWELADKLREIDDPFGVDQNCLNRGGHQPIASCGEIVCVHCSKIF
jgi:hypothetical protein